LAYLVFFEAIATPHFLLFTFYFLLQIPAPIENFSRRCYNSSEGKIMFKSLSDTFKLNNGVEIPCVGFGTYLTPDGKVCRDSVLAAIECGYRHIDTAEFYDNEDGVGAGIRDSGVKRDELFVTTKVWNTNHGFDATLKAFDRSLQKLGLDYLDLYLVHWPVALKYRESYPAEFLETWKAFEKLYNEGRVRALGVCNCLKKHLSMLLENCNVPPAVNQIEYHVGYLQKEAADFSKANNIVVEAWAPLCRGRAFGSEPLKSIAAKYQKTEAQVLVRWCLEHNLLPLPKSVTKARIVENADVFDFSLTQSEVADLDAFEGVGRIGSHPDTVMF